jgi:hypothetical protein
MEFPRPEGRIERYEISWYEVTDAGEVGVVTDKDQHYVVRIIT